jgi:hypothetical protein
VALEVGQVYEATLDVRNASGVLTNPAAAVLTITLPDGTTTTPAVTLPPAVTGHLIYDHPCAMAGLHKFGWVTTSPNTAKTDYVTVRNFISLISVQEAKDHLNFKSGDSDEELSRFMMASTELVEAKAGYTIRRSFTDRISEGVWQIVLPRRPVLSVQSVTSVWPGGPSWTTSQLITDGEAGIIAPATLLFPFWWGPWDVAYTVGRAVPLEKHLHAVKEQLRHLWDTQRGSMAPSLLSGEEVFTASTGFSFTVPRRVLEAFEDEAVPSS